jgi:hypothetical protein
LESERRLQLGESMMFGWFGGMSQEDLDRYTEQNSAQVKKFVRKPNPEVKVEEMFTLSVYALGKHRTSGQVKEIDIEDERLSFSESMLPLISMIQKFKDCRLGSKIKVTMEVID